VASRCGKHPRSWVGTAVQKITLSASRDIPFNKLVLSQSNVRRVKAGVSIEELAEDIARRTLLQGLSVRPVLDAEGNETGMFEVPAGGRRFRALELLVKQKRMTKTQPVPCVVREAGRTHHLRFSDLDMTGDAKPGAIVESRSYEDSAGRSRLSLATRSDLSVEAQVTASGATWIDRQLLAREPPIGGGGFGAEVREAMDRRIDHLAEKGLAQRQGQRIVFGRDLLNTLRRRELDDVIAKLSTETGLAHHPSAEGEYAAGTYRQRVTLASGRFAMIDDGLGFQLVPWRPALEQKLGQHVSGTLTPGGGVEWSFGRRRGLGL